MRQPFGIRLTVTMSITLVLCALGVLTAGLWLGLTYGRELREQSTLTIVLGEDARPGYGAELARMLAGQSYTAEATYISPDSALTLLVSELGENPTEFLGYNPLPPVVELRLAADYVHPDSVQNLIEELQYVVGAGRVDSIDYDASLLERLHGVVRHAMIALAALALALLMVCVTLIGCMVRLTLHADRQLIRTMRLVGASGWFIRRPYIAAHVGYGLWAALLTLVLMGGGGYGLWQFASARPVLVRLLDTLPLALVGGVVVVMGVVLPLLSAWWATDRYLNQSVEAD